MGETITINIMDPEIIFFGCLGEPGHYFQSKRKPRLSHRDCPWGTALDGGLLTDDYYKADTTPNGRTVFVQKDGWVALSFWDRSGDSRGGSNSTFLCHEVITQEELVRLAREQWPEVFRRRNFPNLVLVQPI